MTVKTMFMDKILPTLKPVLHQWLQTTFPEPGQWYDARQRFTQSCALWSIVGHIVGLGDRHGENVLIDSRTAEVMHVDFAAMFDKGEKLEVPERVRFRLTQNLTDVMGICGPQGMFKSCCENALRIVTEHRVGVISVMETLLHDPLIEWGNDRAQRVVPSDLFERLERRLEGYLDLYGERDTIALSIEGQVARMIHHSSSWDNLCEMYIWWMAWI